MRDKRPVDELSIEELERILAIRKREQRQQRLTRMRKNGRVVDVTPSPAPQRSQANVSRTYTDTDGATPSGSSRAIKEGVSATTKTPDGVIGEHDTRDPVFEDEFVVDVPASELEDPYLSKRVINNVFLFIEIVAVLGLIVLGVNMLQAVGSLERETAAAQELANQQRIAGIPTPEPTSIIQVRIEDYVLPGGHTIDENGNAFFNLDEFIDDVPSHLQTAVQEQIFPVNFRRPEPTAETALYLSIPKLGIDQSIVQGTDWEALKLGVGQVQNGANPSDDATNVVLAAHNDVYGELFRYLDQLEAGDEFYIQTKSKTYTYRITGWDIVNPKDVYVMDSQGRSTATLISCYPYGVNNKRYVVFADRVDNAGT